jgi:hypothetical protein
LPIYPTKSPPTGDASEPEVTFDLDNVKVVRLKDGD